MNAVEPPESMRMADVKAELDSLGVSYGDVFEANELRKRLSDARKLQSEDDGSVGSFSKDEVQKLLENPEIIAMLSNPRFQQVLQDSQRIGPEATLRKYKDDPESADMLKTAERLVRGAGLV